MKYNCVYIRVVIRPEDREVILLLAKEMSKVTWDDGDSIVWDILPKTQWHVIAPNLENINQLVGQKDAVIELIMGNNDSRSRVIPKVLKKETMVANDVRAAIDKMKKTLDNGEWHLG
jgi:hypothetical protein